MLLSLSFGALLFTSCASVPMMGLQQDQEAKEFKTEPSKSRIYIYRNENFGGAIKVTVTIDGKLVGQTASNTYFAVDVDSGKHQISCLAESNSQVEVNVKSGEAAYVFQEMKMGLMSAGCALEEVSAIIGQKAVRECKRAQANF